jgi:tetratricopeptide (TPR) repeat protein
MTEQELAEALNHAVEQATGRQRKITDRYIRYLLSGDISWPWGDTRRALEDVLERPVTDLGFVPRGNSPSPTTDRARRLEAPGKGAPPVQRRRLFGIAGGLAAGVTIPTLPNHGRLGMSDVERLRQPLVSLVATDGRQGGVALPDIAAAQARDIFDAVEQLEVSTRVEMAAYTLAGEYLALAGWFAIDADDLLAASDYLNQALRAASIAGDPMLQAQIWNYMAMRARQAGAYTEAHAAARAGLHSNASRRNPKVAALFHSRVAHGHAFRSERGLAERSLGRARDAFARTDAATDTPPWLLFVTEAEIHGLSAMAYNKLGRHEQAEVSARQALRLVPQEQLRNRVHEILEVADARLGLTDAGQAAAEASTALTLATQIRSGVTSGRIASRLRRVRAELSRYPQQAAREWIESYDQALVVA